MTIRTINNNADRDAVVVGEQTAFGACFSVVCGIIARFFPRRAVPSSSPHPSLAISKQSSFSYHIRANLVPIICETNQISRTDTVRLVTWECGRTGTDSGGIECIPLAAGASDEEDGIEDGAVIDSFTSAAAWVVIDMFGNEWLNAFLKSI